MACDDVTFENDVRDDMTCKLDVMCTNKKFVTCVKMMDVIRLLENKIIHKHELRFDIVRVQ